MGAKLVFVTSLEVLGMCTVPDSSLTLVHQNTATLILT